MLSMPKFNLENENEFAQWSYNMKRFMSKDKTKNTDN